MPRPPVPRARPRLFPVAALGLCLAVLGASWAFVSWVSAYGNGLKRKDLADVVSAAAASLDPVQIGRLDAVPENQDAAPLAEVRAQLRRIHDAIPESRFVYLLRQREGRIVFLADAEPADSPDYSAPGDVYEDAPDEFMQAFATPGAQVHGPYHDHWGDWITGLAAVARPEGGPVTTVLAIDTAAHHYLDEVAGYRSFALAIAGLFVAIAALATSIVWLLRRFNERLKSDMDELRRAQESLRLSAAVIENMTEGVMVIDAQLRIESVNPAFERITGYPAADVIGQKPSILFSGKHDDAFFQQLIEDVDRQGHWRGEIWNRRRDGQLYPQATSVNVLRETDGAIRRYATVFSDNEAQNRLEAKLREMSTMDGLTGIANRRSFDEVLEREWSRALRGGRPLSLLLADIDYFKGYNDHHGHVGGDQCLRQVAQAIAGAVNRTSDLAARYGGEEFAVILPEADAAAAALLAEKIRAGVAALALPHGTSTASDFVTISVGAATLVPKLSRGEAELVQAADHALYQAKHGGRNRVVTAPEVALDTADP